MECLPKKDQDFQLSWVVWGLGLANQCGMQLLSGCVLMLCVGGFYNLLYLSCPLLLVNQPRVYKM